MNYIKELNAFREWQLSNVLPANAISLWYTLMSINNSTGWKKKFNAPNTIVWQFSGLTKQGLLDARNKLKEQNLIKFEGGKRGQASVYEMIPLTLTAASKTYQSQDESVYQSNGESQGESTYQSLDQSQEESACLLPDESHGESQGEFQPVLKHMRVGSVLEKIIQSHSGSQRRIANNPYSMNYGRRCDKWIKVKRFKCWKRLEIFIRNMRYQRKKRKCSFHS